ncbi:hypothetical protein I302_102158 [Kwoniella bestiolae CBS 10118]|uniref:Uncharacterized protein n=1 Tax=Kwoniella bestiolae CBS 10118 TaxID=1296100 RepID=A0A1B9GEC8_9TREE|nr:hypothetical protein I302_00847 [Kwoniella bestiolae CBS 10118]OCF29345.1 hypothetical protein I302_00847 [Kwoniella bestiolae CBS 10118]
MPPQRTSQRLQAKNQELANRDVESQQSEPQKQRRTRPKKRPKDWTSKGILTKGGKQKLARLKGFEVYAFQGNHEKPLPRYPAPPAQESSLPTHECYIEVKPGIVKNIMLLRDEPGFIYDCAFKIIDGVPCEAPLAFFPTSSTENPATDHPGTKKMNGQSKLEVRIYRGTCTPNGENKYQFKDPKPAIVNREEDTQALAAASDLADCSSM